MQPNSCWASRLSATSPRDQDGTGVDDKKDDEGAMDEAEKNDEDQDLADMLFDYEVADRNEKGKREFGQVYLGMRATEVSAGAAALRQFQVRPTV